jgi:hypothetical protein
MGMMAYCCVHPGGRSRISGEARRYIPAQRAEEVDLPLWLTKRGVLARATEFFPGWCSQSKGEAPVSLE